MGKLNQSFEYLLSKKKKEVLEQFGDGFNFYPRDEWAYFLGKNFWGIRSFLIIKFRNDEVINVSIKKTFRRTLLKF